MRFNSSYLFGGLSKDQPWNKQSVSHQHPSSELRLDIVRPQGRQHWLSNHLEHHCRQDEIPGPKKGFVDTYREHDIYIYTMFMAVMYKCIIYVLYIYTDYRLVVKPCPQALEFVRWHHLSLLQTAPENFGADAQIFCTQGTRVPKWLGH